MTETMRNAMVGLFVLAGLGALASLMVMFGERPEWVGGAEWELTVRGVRQLRDIRDGTEVSLNGVSVGRVDRLQFKDARRPGLGVDIVIKIKNDYIVPQNTYAEIYSPAMGIGRGRIELIVEEPGKYDPIERDGSAMLSGRMANALNDIIPEEMIDSLHETIEKIGVFAQTLTPAAEDLHKILETRRVEDVDRSMDQAVRITANLSTVIERFDDALRHVNDVIGDEQTQQDLKETVAKLHRSGEQLEELLITWRQESQAIADDVHSVSDNLNTGIDRTEEEIQTFFAGLAPILVNLDDASKYLTRASRQAAEGRGTVGLMLNDPRLYESMVYSFEQIGQLVATLKPLAEKIAVEQRVPIKLHTAVGPINHSVNLKPKNE